MRKYLHLFKMQIDAIATYRFDLMTNWIYRFTKLIIYYYLWSLTAQNAEEETFLLQYYILFFFIFDPLGTSRLVSRVSKEVHSGALNNFLLKPINYMATSIINLTSLIIARLAVPIFIVTLLIIFFPDTFAPASSESLLLFLVFTVLYFIMWNCFTFLIACISLWGTEVGFTMTVVDLVLNVVKGVFIPYYLFPESLKNILALTPIRFMGAYQIELFQTQVVWKDVLINLSILLFWTFTFFILANLIYKKGLKTYDALGA